MGRVGFQAIQRAVGQGFGHVDQMRGGVGHVALGTGQAFGRLGGGGGGASKQRGNATPSTTTGSESPSANSGDGTNWARPAGDHPRRDITLGENVDLSQEPGYPDIAITIARVTRDPSCPHGPPPRLGQYVALDMMVRRTTPDASNVGITTLEWEALAADGTGTKIYGLSGFLCQKPMEQFPLRFGERQEVRGQLILDVPIGTTTLSATSAWNSRAARLLIPVEPARS